MSRINTRSPQSQFCRPRLEILEDRCVLDAAQNVLMQAPGIFAIFNENATIKANLAALVANHQLAAAVQSAEQAFVSLSQEEVVQLETDVNQIEVNVNTQIVNLEELFNNETSTSINNLNNEVLAIENSVNALPPDQRAAATQAAAKQIFQLQDGTTVQLKNFRDILGGQESAVVSISNGFISYTTNLAVKAEQNSFQSEALVEESAVIESQPTTPQPGTPTGNKPGLITNHSPNHELNIVPTGSDPRFPDSVLTVADYNNLIRTGQKVPNISDPSPNSF